MDRKIPWRLSRHQKYRQRERLRHVDSVIETLDNALARRGQSMKKVERWKMEMPTEPEMLPKDKYSVFDRKVKRYRKGIHSTRATVRVEGTAANVQQRYRSGRESAKDSILLVSRQVWLWLYEIEMYTICHDTFCIRHGAIWTNIHPFSLESDLSDRIDLTVHVRNSTYKFSYVGKYRPWMFGTRFHT